MRIRELRLLAYGPFTDVSLEFGGPSSDMHVVYGPNEAGKSTSLRAITALLYGIPTRTPDAHLHDNKKLRIGGVIEHGRDGVVDVVRRKGRKHTLLDRDDKPIDEAVLTRALCGVSQALFVTMFGLDHVSLRDGAQALLRGDGDVGETLFDAGGARGIGRVLDELHAEADAIYKPRGQTPKLNDALKRLKDAKQRIFMKEMLPSAWLNQKEATEEARAEYDALVQRRHALGAERNRLQRALRAFPHLTRRRDLQRRIEALGVVPALSPQSRERRVAAEQEAFSCARRGAELREEIALLNEERAGRLVNEELAGLSEEVIRDITDRLGNHRKALVDLPRREATLAERRREAEGLLRDLGQDVALDEVHQLHVDKPARARIDALKNAFGRVTAELESSERLRDEARVRRDVARSRLATLAPLVDVETLRAALTQALREGDFEAREAAAEARAAGSRRRVDELAQLLGAGVSAPPPRAAAATQALSIDALERRRLELERVGTAARARQRVVLAELAELVELGAPSAADLQAVRARRDEHWSALVGDTERTMAVEPFEAALRESDRVADQLWQQAERVAKRARLTREQGAIDDELGALGRDAEALRGASEAAVEAWRTLWEGVDAPPSPATWERWWLDYEALSSARGELRASEAEVAAGRARTERHRAALAAWFDAAELRSMIDSAQARIQAEDERRHTRRALEEKLADLEEQLAVLEGRHAAASHEVADWRVAWRAAVAALGLGENASVDEVAAVEDLLAEVFSRVREADDLARRIEGMRRDAAEFEAVVEPLLSRFAPGQPSQSLEAAAEGLVKSYRRTQADYAWRQDLDDKVAAKRAQLAEIEERAAAAETVLAELMRVAGASDVRSLSAIEVRVEELARLQQGLRECEGALFEEGDIDDLAMLTEDLDLDATRERATELEEDYKGVIERCEHLSTTIGASERGLEDLEKKEGAAAAAAAREETLASIVHQAARYTRLRLAAAVLEDEIESYRQQHQGPVLARASEIFPRLTLGHYASLSVGFDDHDEPALRCTRPDGTEVDVTGLSDGTRDQLYLSLRLASIERYGQKSELLPLVVDDVLIHFDDDRARAALKVLSELSRVTQVLFFTHHARLVELAQDLDGVRHHTLR